MKPRLGISGPKVRHVIARPEGPGNPLHKNSRGLKGRPRTRAARVPPLQGGICLGTITWGFTPGCHIAGFQPSEQRRIVTELDALQAEGDALKRLQAETAGRLGLHAPMDALLPATLDRAFKGEL